MEARDETPIDAVIEMCVYAPLGFALEARSLLPRFVERGRNQVAMARVVGKFAARKGREGLEERVGEGHALVMGLLELTGVVDGSPDAEPSTSVIPTINRTGRPDAASRARSATK